VWTLWGFHDINIIVVRNWFMKNLVSYNELADWKYSDKQSAVRDDQYSKVSDYFQCITESESKDHTARHFCRTLLDP
jgi:uncharacterized Fe-S radical SAM superfamily protein PflX